MATVTARKSATKNIVKKPAKNSKQSSTSHKPVPDKKSGGPFEDNFDSSIKDLFLSELKDMYWAENHLVGAIPKMIDGANGAELKKALKNHLQETMQHVERLVQVFEKLGMPAMPKKCDAMEGLTMGGEHIIENTLAGSAGREAGVINSGIKVEQFEITCYTGLIKMATQLGISDAVPLLEQNRNEEITASEKLSKLNNPGNKN